VEINRQLDAPLLRASAAQAQGAVLLAEGDARDALRALRSALVAWEEVAAPYEAARVRVLLGLACRMLGDEDGATLDLDAARAAFRQLGAAPDLARLETLDPLVPSPNVHGLTPREHQVLRLVAGGESNRTIAVRLFISERTVERHVSNIFTKLNVSSRAAATAFAYERQLL
jgi:DNA-binding NarL/FixJ family response regulator